MTRVRDPFTRPVDRALFALRLQFGGPSYRWWKVDPNVWVAFCPLCKCFDAFTLTLTERWEGGDITIECLNGCDERIVRLALGVPSVQMKLGRAKVRVKRSRP